jgi:hypothetical protein
MSRWRAVEKSQKPSSEFYTEIKKKVLGHFQRPIKLPKSPERKIRNSKSGTEMDPKPHLNVRHTD